MATLCELKADPSLRVDTGHANPFAQLSLKEPKARFTTDKHQKDYMVFHFYFSNHREWWAYSQTRMRVNQRVVDMCVQEVSCFQFLAILTEPFRSMILQLGSAFLK